MCGIAGFSSFNVNYNDDPNRWAKVLYAMNKVQKHRGPDEDGIFLSDNCGLAHVRLSIIDLTTGSQPMTARLGEHMAGIVFNGEIYNMRTLREELRGEGIDFKTTSDTEVVLKGYLKYGCEFVKRLNGIFAFAIWDESLKRLLLYRDRLGVKPLFYAFCDDTFIFSSEIKGILSYPGMAAEVGKEGLCEIFALGPAKTYGKGVFKGVSEVCPGCFMEISESGVKTNVYWALESHPHTESFEATVEHTEYLVTDAIKMQMLSDVPICTFLSGGVDSSFVTAVCSEQLKKQGKRLETYSFDFIGNDVNFVANAFQPSQDRPWVDKMVEFSDTDHRYLYCRNEELYELLFEAVNARDLPCMADVESSMLYFCREVAKNHKVALTGECADEIFGGYPWFHKKECFDADCFPWSMDFSTRTVLLKDEVLNELPLFDYAQEAYHNTLAEVPRLLGESQTESRRREISFLNLKWFMQTLLDRMDRTSMYAGLEARVPMADHRIVEYLWNVPWDVKCKNGVVKGLLRAAGEKHLPYEVLYRKKSPYPKTYDPAYENMLKDRVRDMLYSNSPLNILVDRAKVEKFIESPSDYGRPFYGQLMAGPQLLAYMLQINYWLEHYNIAL